MRAPCAAAQRMPGGDVVGLADAVAGLRVVREHADRQDVRLRRDAERRRGDGACDVGAVVALVRARRPGLAGPANAVRAGQDAALEVAV